MKSLLQPGMQVLLKNGSLCPVMVSKQGNYIRLNNAAVIIVDRDYNDDLICDEYYGYNIDGIFDIPSLEESDVSIGIYEHGGNLIWSRHTGLCNGCASEKEIFAVSDILKQIKILRDNIIATSSNSIVFDYANVTFKIEEAISELFKTSTKAGKSHG